MTYGVVNEALTLSATVGTSVFTYRPTQAGHIWQPRSYTAQYTSTSGDQVFTSMLHLVCAALTEW
jgi:hypothetical protein